MPAWLMRAAAPLVPIETERLVAPESRRRLGRLDQLSSVNALSKTFDRVRDLIDVTKIGPLCEIRGEPGASVGRFSARALKVLFHHPLARGGEVCVARSDGGPGRLLPKPSD